MLISRMVEDPHWIIRPNKVARTIGFYGHTPKFWSCKDYDFDAFWKSHSREHTVEIPDLGVVTIPADITDPEQIRELQESAAEQREAHAQCKRKHMSYVGYLVFVGPRNRYTFWYMGNSYRPGKIFEKHRAGTIIFGKKVINKSEPFAYLSDI